MSDSRRILEEALARSRTRQSWNDRLAHWERPASDHEEAKIQRAATAARAVVDNNATLTLEEVVIKPQGSYFNNTNVRLEADMDLRVQLPNVVVRYANGIEYSKADQFLGYTDTGRTIYDVATLVRNELAADCRRRFGSNRVTVGKKAVTVADLTGTSADVDLVPAFRLHWVVTDNQGGYDYIEGVAIIGEDRSETINFPEQHHRNGKLKRERTQHRFKKVVRMLKRLNYELEEHGSMPKRLPSFLVGCLVYVVEDGYFLYREDRYDRLRRIVGRIQDLLSDARWVNEATEVNEIKYLFRTGQAWSLDQARHFAAAALARLAA